MKITINLLLAVIMATICCSVGNAQIIYSNNFALGAAVDITNTPPTVANDYAGGVGSTNWLDVLGAADPGNPGLYANGLDNCASSGGNSWILPFTPTNNSHIYLLNVTVTFTNNPGNWIGAGFAQTYANQASGLQRFSDSVAGVDWEIITEASGNVQGWGGAKTALPFGSSQNGLFTPGPGTHTMSLVLNTETTLWGAAAYVDGVQFGTYVNYTVNPVIHAVGITQTALSAPNSVQYNNFALITTLQPFIVQQPTQANTTLGGGSLYTNKVTVIADPAGGPLSYQWYAGGLPLTNSASISGANTNLLMINPILTPNQFTNYYVVVTNNYGSATSSLASVTVLTNPVVTMPPVPNNQITLFGGTSISGTSYVGSSPAFSVTAVGAPPLAYYWLTNGVVVDGATNANVVFTNLPAGGPTSFVCIASNSFGTVTDTWSATYTQTPLAPYPQAVLASVPVDFWRLNEPDDGNNDGNPGAVCHDYQSGNNGVYTNVYLGYTGYNPSEPTETSAFFGSGGSFFCYAGQMQNEDFAVTNGGNAEFTVEAWVNSFSGNGASIVAQGVHGVSDSFNLGMDTNHEDFQFYVRSAAGTVYTAQSSIAAGDSVWHHLVGVCDEANTNVTLYIDGQVVGSTSIPAKSGLFEAAAPIAIGAGYKSGTGYNLQFQGLISDVATYSHALSAGQVIGHYAAFGNPVPASFISPPPTNVVYLANQTLTIPATVAGSATLGYYWVNLTAGGMLGSGQTGTAGSLAATLTIPNASAGLSGDQLELVVTNAAGSTNWVVTLFSPAPPVALDYSNPILYSNNFNGGTWSIAGMPLTAANSLVGGTNTTWVDALGTNSTGSGMMASGNSGTTQADSWLLPFAPHAGYIYTASASLTFSGYPGSWVGIDFAQNIPVNATSGQPQSTFINSYGLVIMTESSSNVQYFAGPGTTTTILSKNNFFTPNTGPHTVQTILDTTGTQWKEYAYVDGIAAGTNTFSAPPAGATTNNPPIHAVGITQNALTAPGLVQWNSFSLTQVAPGGVPPYALASLPTNVTLLADTALSIPVTTYGSAPFGYYWSNTNTAAILGSGTAGSMTPLSANLSVADVPDSWNGNTLALVMTNAYGTNISLVSVTVTNLVIIPTNSPTITGFSLVGGTNVVINATNGQSGGTYYLLGSTNLTTPLSQWLPLATNVITTNGSPVNGFTLIVTNVIHAGTPQQFYILSNTNETGD